MQPVPGRRCNYKPRFIHQTADPPNGGSSARPGPGSPPRRRPPYTPRCACDATFPQAVAAGPGSKPSVCRYIQRCSFLKEGPREKLIVVVGAVTTKEENKGPNDSERPQAPSLQAACGLGGSCSATAWASLVRGHFASQGRKVSGKRSLSNCSTTAQLPKPTQTKTPALPAGRSARAARLPGEEGIPRPTLTPAMQCALPSGFLPARSSGKTTRSTAHCVARELLALAQSQ